jgi:thiosulfate/3-mercaptopyruvate sulfurtransferase
MYTTIIDRNCVYAHLEDPAWVFVDCRFDLARPEAGTDEYLAEHLPRAVYAHLDKDLSGPPITNRGRHPLPLPEVLRTTFSSFGIDSGKQVVLYDGAGGSICARLWWLLNYMGHETVAVLDGGWPAWKAADLPTASGNHRNPPTNFIGAPHPSWIVHCDEVQNVRSLFDARDPARYRGEVEPIDPVAGHIPGAANAFWKDNLDTHGEFVQPAGLRQRYEALLAGTPADEAVFYCGSGVTACNDLLAVRHAGLPMPRLYAGSWSEWCGDPTRPIATGPE